MSLTHTIESEFDNGAYYFIITLHCVNDCYENEISLCDHDHIDVWKNLIKHIKSDTEYAYGSGGNSFSTIGVKDGNVNICSNVSGSGGDITTTFKVRKEIFLPIAKKIIDEMQLFILLNA